MAAARSLDSLADTFERLTEKTRRHGLLSLGDDLASIEDEALRLALGLVKDGTPPTIILDTLRARIRAAGDQGPQNEAEHDRLCCIALGTIALQQGYPPRVLRKLLTGFAAAD